MKSKEDFLDIVDLIIKDKKTVDMFSPKWRRGFKELASHLYDYLTDEKNKEEGEEVVSEEKMIEKIHSLFDGIIYPELVESFVSIGKDVRDYIIT